ncbi:hypothetical protein MMC26_007507, partial [Xylographa opegraphella]|nr:hypothetical protein [Xylographa opegraphella]
MLPALRPGDQEADPLRRFWATDGPWNPQAITGGTGNQALSRDISLQGRAVRPHSSFLPYREPARSDPGSHFTGRGPSDSGYATKSQVTRSVVSADYRDQSQENQSLIGGMFGIQIQAQGNPHDFFYRDSQDTRSLGYENLSNDAQETVNNSSSVYECQDRGITCKNHSDYKKHLQRYGKPFVCKEAGCNRGLKGFGTKNDLDRHKKSVHHIIPENTMDRSFKCAGTNCAKKEKVWPRLDNFKSHCIRMHNTDDLDELIKQSEVEEFKVLSSHTDMPRFSFDSKASESEDADENLRPDCTSVHSLGLAMEQKDRVPSAQAVAAHYGHSLAAGTDSTDTLEPEMLRGLPGGHHGELERPVGEQAKEEPRTRADTGSTIYMDSEQYARVNSDNDRQLPPDAQPSSSCRMIENDFRRKAYADDRQPRFTSKGRLNDLFSPMFKIKAQEFSKAVASQVSDCLNNTNSSPEDIELIIQTRVMSLLNESNPKKRKSGEIESEDSTQSNTKRITCSVCPKTVGRLCDLNKSFGSKNDWKRHENSQHPQHNQLDTWRCNEPTPTSEIYQCAKVSYRRDDFQDHLRVDHKINDEAHIQERCKKSRIGRNGQGGFWCGFCKEVVKLHTRGLEAWDERFNHINDHFKRELSIANWYPVDKDVPKGLLKTSNMHSNGGLYATMHGSDSEQSDTDEVWGRMGPPQRRPPPPPPPPPPLSPPPPPPPNLPDD